MEQKLLDLKEQFCKWYCSARDEKIDISYICSMPEEERTCNEDCAIESLSICDYCKLEEYIRFIRNDL